MKLWHMIVQILLWPGHMALRLFPGLGPEESRLLAHMANYIFWLTLVCAPLTYFIIVSQLPK